MPKTKLQESRVGSTENQREQPAFSTIAERSSRPFICEAVTLHAYDELPYVFALEMHECLEFALRSDAPLDVLLCNMADYERWVDSGYDPEVALLVHLEAEDVTSYRLQFTAPIAGEYAVLLMNWTECAADLVVEIPDLLVSALR